MKNRVWSTLMAIALCAVVLPVNAQAGTETLARVGGMTLGGATTAADTPSALPARTLFPPVAFADSNTGQIFAKPMIGETMRLDVDVLMRMGAIKRLTADKRDVEQFLFSEKLPETAKPQARRLAAALYAEPRGS